MTSAPSAINPRIVATGIRVLRIHGTPASLSNHDVSVGVFESISLSARADQYDAVFGNVEASFPVAFQGGSAGDAGVGGPGDVPDGSRCDGTGSGAVGAFGRDRQWDLCALGRGDCISVLRNDLQKDTRYPTYRLLGPHSAFTTRSLLDPFSVLMSFPSVVASGGSAPGLPVSGSKVPPSLQMPIPIFALPRFEFSTPREALCLTR